MRFKNERSMCCPRCGSRDLRASYPGGALDFLLVALGFRPLRCRRCLKRFHRIFAQAADIAPRLASPTSAACISSSTPDRRLVGTSQFPDLYGN